MLASALLLGASIATLREGGALSTAVPLRSDLEAARAAALVAAQPGAGSGGSSFLLIFRSTTLTVADPRFRDEVARALAPIGHDPRVNSVLSPYDAPSPAAAGALTSADGHAALVSVGLRDAGTRAEDDFAALRPEVRSASLQVTATGPAAVVHAFSTTLESDLQRAEDVSLPLVLVLLLLIFASAVAAGLPLAVGVLTILGGLAGTYFLSHLTDTSAYALNVVTLIGLGVSIDYSLFVVSRFRDELAGGASRQEAIAATVATAGRAVAFSGLTVVVGLSAMLFYQGTFLASVGAAGAMVVAVAVLYALTLLPALLSILGPAVDRFSVPVPRGRPGRGFWALVAVWVMRRPLIVLVPTLGFLVLATLPVLQLRLAGGDVELLPGRLEARQANDRLLADFPAEGQTTFQVVIDYPDGTALTPDRVGDQRDLARRVAAVPGVRSAAIAASAGRVAVIEAATSLPPTSDGARDVLAALRRTRDAGDGGRVLVGGQTAADLDTVDFILGRTPLAVGFVVLATCAILFLLTGSAVLPLKAVLVNLLSIGAAFGALVWIFQEGHLSRLLGFTPQSIDPSILVILFSTVFGTSMDYEVLMLSRIQEEYLDGADNARAVAAGLQRSGRLITGAAAIMIAVFGAFGLAELVLIKAIGVGLAIAVAIDATIARTLLVPAAMRLLGDLNWWAPGPARRLWPAIEPRGVTERSDG
jgi:RND superfamily putative drug exporter